MNLIKRIEKKLRGIGKKIGVMDDFNWSIYYEDEYSKQIQDLEKQYTFILPAGKYSISNGKIILDSNLPPLNENHRVLYETIYTLKPDSIFEVGCGCGDHLANIKMILPQILLSGLDISQKQLDFLFNRHPELKNQVNLFVNDITIHTPKISKVDLVYTQAVLMHIQRYKHYLSALKNLFFISEKYIILMENWTRHNFVEDIKKVSKAEDFPWKNIYFYVNDTSKQISLIISVMPLSKFKELKSSNELLKYFNEKHGK